MKNGVLVTAYLDECAKRSEMIQSDDLETLLALDQRWDVVEKLWKACLSDGWTHEELCAAYYRRFPDHARRTKVQ